MSIKQNTVIDHRVDSDYYTEARMITVTLPQSYTSNDNQVYPVLFHLGFDGDAFEMIDDTLQSLYSNNAIPEVIIVTLQHDESDHKDDITPNIEGTAFNGKPELFLEHIENEVMPLLEQNYRISDDRIMTGWSRFGAFTTLALALKPQLFSGYIVRSSAPSGLLSFLQSKLQEMITQNPDTSNTFYFAIGTKGNEQSRKKAFDDLKAMLSNEVVKTKEFRWKSQVIDDAGHLGTFQPGLKNGLLFYFSEK